MYYFNLHTDPILHLYYIKNICISSKYVSFFSDVPEPSSSLFSRERREEKFTIVSIFHRATIRIIENNFSTKYSRMNIEEHEPDLPNRCATIRTVNERWKCSRASCRERERNLSGAKIENEKLVTLLKIWYDSDEGGIDGRRSSVRKKTLLVPRQREGVIS